MDTLPHIVIALPTRDTPGYFKRQKRIMEYATRWKAREQSGEITAELIGEMIDLFADYVTEPSPREAAIDALWEASEAQLDDLLSLFQSPNAGSPAATSNNGSTVGQKDG